MKHIHVGLSSNDHALSCTSQHGAKFKHPGDTTGFTLNVPHFSVKQGELVAIAGRVGAGKTSLINAVLGNMERLDGTCSAGGRVAYVPQNPWCQNLSLRESILFGNDMDQVGVRGPSGRAVWLT